MKNSIVLVTLVASWLLVGCQSKSDSLGPSPVLPGEEKISADGVKIEVNPKVDVLFVMDDSGSMKAHQANLVKNTKSFVEGFGKNSLIDVHVGVTTVWDSERYGAYDPETNKVLRAGIVPQIGRDKRQLFYPIGHLRPLKAPAGKEASLSKQAGNFVSKGDDFVDILSETLNVGISNYEGKSSDTKDAEGPEFEEVFSPVMAALREPVSNAWNKGFHRNDGPNKSHLVVIFLTDANDASTISAQQMFRFLTNLKDGRENFTVFGVVNPSSSKGGCARDPAGPPLKIESLVRMTNGKILDICGDYAAQLVEIGRIIQDHTLNEIRIKPRSLPTVDSIEVKYGTEVIRPDQWKGWTWDAATSSIIIRGASQWTDQPGAKISVDFKKVNPSQRTARCTAGCTQSSAAKLPPTATAPVPMPTK